MCFRLLLQTMEVNRVQVPQIPVSSTRNTRTSNESSTWFKLSSEMLAGWLKLDWGCAISNSPCVMCTFRSQSRLTAELCTAETFDFVLKTILSYARQTHIQEGESCRSISQRGYTSFVALDMRKTRFWDTPAPRELPARQCYWMIKWIFPNVELSIADRTRVVIVPAARFHFLPHLFHLIQQHRDCCTAGDAN